MANFISKHYTYSTTSNSKTIAVAKPAKGSDELKTFMYIPKTKDNLRQINLIHGKPDVYDDKRYGKRVIWW